MDPVSNADRVVRILREQLERKSKTRVDGKSKPGTVDLVERGNARVAATVGSIARQGLDESALQRLIVEHLLVEQFGSQLVNDAKFQQIVDCVMDMIITDKGTRALLHQALVQLRADVTL
jgi:hypothetical protein